MTIQDQLIELLPSFTRRRRRGGLIMMVTFGVAAAACLAWAAGTQAAEVPSYALASCERLGMPVAHCASDYRLERAFAPLVLCGLWSILGLIGFAVFLRFRSASRSPIGKTILSQGRGLKAVYTQRTKVLAAGIRVGEFYEIVFERQSGRPLKWELPDRQLRATYDLLKIAMPEVAMAPLSG